MKYKIMDQMKTWVESLYTYLTASSENWREQLFSVLSKMTLVFAAPGLIITLIIFYSQKEYLAFFVFCFVSLLWLFITFVPKISFKTRVNLGLFVIFSVAVTSIWITGFVGSGRAYLISFVILAGLFLGLKENLTALILQGGFLILTWYLIKNGVITKDWALSITGNQILLNGLVLLMITTMLSISISFLVRFLEQSKQAAEDLSFKLININTQLQKEVDERIRAEQNVQKSHQQLLSILDNFPEALYVSDPHTYRLEFINNTLKQTIQTLGLSENMQDGFCYQVLYGYDQPCPFCTNQIILTSNEPYLGEFQHPISKRHYLVTDRLIETPENRKLRLEVSVDITERKLAEEKLKHDALHDALTGLANRALLLQRIEHSLAHLRRFPNSKSALMFFDLDNFKLINDTYGHSQGDALLIEIANRLVKTVREVDLVARLGGDEFVILLEDFHPPGTFFMILDRVLNELRKPFLIEGKKIITSGSVGVVLDFSLNDNAEQIIQDADIAMYQAKEQGRNKFIIFSPDMRKAVYERTRLEQDLRRAIVLREFEVYYQPIVKIKNQEIVGFEALIRWNHPERGLLAPKHFLQVAEELNLMTNVGRQLIQTAIRQVKVWQEKYGINGEKFTLSINFTPKQLHDEELIEILKENCSTHAFDPLVLNMEITENLVMEHFQEIAEKITEIRSMGIHLHLDDFGKDHSSFGKLKSLSFDAVKLDRVFIHDLHTNHGSREIVQAIIILAKDLKMHTIAEGIENEEQLSILQELDCQYYQGYLFTKPLPAQETETLLMQTRSMV